MMHVQKAMISILYCYIYKVVHRLSECNIINIAIKILNIVITDLSQLIQLYNKYHRYLIVYIDKIKNKNVHSNL